MCDIAYGPSDETVRCPSLLRRGLRRAEAADEADDDGDDHQQEADDGQPDEHARDDPLDRVELPAYTARVGVHAVDHLEDDVHAHTDDGQDHANLQQLLGTHGFLR